MLEQISFIHAADLHLDSPFKGLHKVPEDVFREIRQSTFTAFDNLVRYAIAKKVDFILIAGDLFDNEKQSLKAQIYLRTAFEKLAEHDIAIFLCYGNHDFISGNKHPITYPENVHIFPDEQVRHFTYKKNGSPLACIHGFSYENRAVREKKISEYRLKESLAPFQIAMLHGSLEGNTEHAAYAPFQLRELTGKGFDYWALGHIHKREILKEKPAIVYPGNIQGRSRKEAGPKGCYHVTMTKTETDLVFVPLQAIEFSSLEINATACAKIDELELLIQSELHTSLSETNPHLVHVTVTGDNEKLILWEQGNQLDELLEIINDVLLRQDQWSYIYGYKVKQSRKPFLHNGEHFIDELNRQVEEVSIPAFLKELYRHREARKYLQELTPEDEQWIKEQATELLYNAILNDGEEKA